MKLKKCTGPTRRHKWDFEANVILTTVRETATHTTVDMSTRGKYICATCGAKKYGASRIPWGGADASY